MPGLQRAARHGRRPLRVVTLHRAATFDEEERYAWEIGLEACGLTRAHFPAFYAAHVGPHPCTLPKLLGVIAAFFQLVEGRGLALRWPHTYMDSLEAACEATPEETAYTFDGVSEEYLGELSYFVAQPRPAYRGVGVQLSLDFASGQLEDPLLLGLWRLLDGTRYATGLDIPSLAARTAGAGLQGLTARRTAAAAELALRLRPLPDDLLADGALLTRIARQIPEAASLPDPALLLRYAVAQTGNPLADTSDDEIGAVYDGEDPQEWSWDELDELAALSQQAQQLERAFDAWSTRVRRAPETGIAELGRAARRSVASLRRGQRAAGCPPRALIDILGGLPADEPLEVAAL